MAADEWTNDATFCCRACLAKRVRTTNRNGSVFVQGTNQSALHSVLVPMTDQMKRFRGDRHQLVCLQRELQAVEDAFDGDVQFVNMFKKKKNRNSTNLPFRGTGKEKCLTLMSRGTLSAHDLLNCEGSDPAIKEHWKDIMQAHCCNLAREMASLRSRTSKLQDDILIKDAIENDTTADDTEDTTTATTRTTTSPNPEGSPPPFSRLTDREKCNSRMTSKPTVDRIKSTDCQRRKTMQLAKMRFMPAKAWKTDWGHKIAPKIKVHTGRGKPHSPHQSVVSTQNEDSLTVFWKCCPCSEGMDGLMPDLIRLKKRNEILGENVEVSWVDNCCSVRSKLQEVAPGMLVKLDCFHWQARFDPAMADTTSETTAIFRTMMRRAAFQTEDTERHRVRDLLKRKGKPHTPGDILKAAKATIPAADLLERRAMAVVHACMEKDSETDRQNTVAPANKKPLQRFFKPGAETINIITNQLSHVRKGCSSDPCDSVLQIHRHNPATDKTCSARGTGGNEAAWRCTNRLLDTPSIGVTRAEQAMHNCFEADNGRKRVRRLGEEAEETSRAEQLRSLGTMAKECGFKGNDIPTTHLECPREIDGLTEHIGMDCKLASTYNVDDVRDDAEDDDSEASDKDLADFLRDLNFVDDAGADSTGVTGGVDISEDFLNDEEFEPVDVFAVSEEIDVSICVPTIVSNKKTCDTFSRLAKGQPWVPFKEPREIQNFTDTDRAEAASFQEMRGNFNRFQNSLSHAAGHKSFARAWNFKVLDSFKKQLEGERVTLVNRKSCKQLQDCCDVLQRQKQLEGMSRANDPIIQRMETELRTTRRLLAPHQSAINCAPINFGRQIGTPSFGVPYALNADIAANAFQHNQHPTAENPNPIILRTLPTVTPQPPQITRGALGVSFKAKKFCWRCGWQKKQHVRANMPFGDGCTGNCGYEQCSKCDCRLFPCRR